jgi:hypothetical protein
VRKVIKKVFMAWNFDKEEKWLNEMAAKGLCLVAVGYCRYEFEECLPGEYTIRLEMLKQKPNHPESQQYISFMEETGAEQVGSFLRWVYFRKKTAEGAFEIFSDYDSRIRHLQRIISLIGVLAGVNIGLGIYNIGLILTWGTNINLIGFVNVAIGLWASWGAYRLYKKKNKLGKEKQIYE